MNVSMDSSINPFESKEFTMDSLKVGSGEPIATSVMPSSQGTNAFDQERVVMGKLRSTSDSPVEQRTRNMQAVYLTQ